MTDWLKSKLDNNHRIIPYSILDKGKRTTVFYCLQWIEDHIGEIDHFINSVYTPKDYDFVLDWLKDNPRLCMCLVSDFFKSNDEKIKEIKHQFKAGKSKIVLITGGRGAGKTALAFWLAELLKKERPIYYAGEKVEGLPDWIKITDTPMNTPHGSLIICDEVGLSFNAREYQKREHTQLTKQLATLRHDNKTILLMTQHTKIADINLIRLGDCIFYKQQSSFQKETERDLSKDSYRTELINNLMPTKKNETLFVMGFKIIKFIQPLPKFWSDKLSKGWKGYHKTKQIEQRKKDKKNKVITTKVGVKYRFAE
jgi:nicotinamide riboside kinase